jgi:hypothetical protein
VSLRNLVVEWLEWGCEPGQLDTLSPENKRQFVADVFDAEPDWFHDSVGEYFTRNPGARSRLISCFRDGDFLQVGAIIDHAFVEYVIRTCAEFWDSEFTQVQEQEQTYAGDE